MTQQHSAVATATAPPPMAQAVARLPLPEKDGWERVEGRLSGGYYRRLLASGRDASER
ncbi:MAG TPA: hypothetical protein VFA70_05090 [Dehalococcoidia bacterium]|jgi:hypothetical protein|nr:hypothetical protein [Dehalococcoidia bacterium]